MYKYYENLPSSYFSHLFGHESQNSILSLLIKEGYALNLSAGGHTEINLFTTFSITIGLTEKGLNEYETVCSIVFQYL